MMSESPYSSSNLDHLGLVAGMIDELGLPELIDTQSVHPMALSMIAALLQADPRLFFKPIQLHIQLPDFCIQPIWIALLISRFRSSFTFK